MPSMSCPACGHSISVAENAAGKRVMCSKGGEIIHVPRSLIYPNEDDVLAPYGRPRPRNWRDHFKQHRQSLADPKIQGLVSTWRGLPPILLSCLPNTGFYI